MVQVRTEDIALVEPIGGNDCVWSAVSWSSRRGRVLVRRTGDAQVGLPGAVHDARRGCAEESMGREGRRLSELAAILVLCLGEEVLDMRLLLSRLLAGGGGVGRGCREMGLCEEPTVRGLQR